MDYFIMFQDKRISNVVEPVGIQKSLIKDRDELPVQFDIKENRRHEYVDLIENPVPLISDKVKQILSKYDKKLFLKPIMLCDRKEVKQNLYWLMIPKSIDCLSSNTEFNKDGSLKRLVINKKKVGNHKIFKINGIMENLIIIRLDVAESLFRRYFTGIRTKKVEKD